VTPDDFQDLLESLAEANAIRRGERAPSREFRYAAPDIRAIRRTLGLTQRKFAAMIGVSLHTLRNWEQGRRRPDGPAMALLRVAEYAPQVVAEALRG
jgi:putative transcriptional regulator